MNKHMIQLIRRELLSIRFGDRTDSIGSQVYLQGFMHCAYYHGGMITSEAYAIIQELMRNAMQHFHNDRMRIEA